MGIDGLTICGPRVLDCGFRRNPAEIRIIGSAVLYVPSPSHEPDIMLDPQTDPERRKMVLTSQIIVAALFAGCLFCLLIVLLILPGKLGNWHLGLDKPMTSVGLVAAFGILAARIILPGVITAQMLRQLAGRKSKEPDWKDLFGVYQTTLIIKVAMLEGATFLLVIVYMIEHSPWTLTLAVVFLLLLLMHMPTPLRVDDGIERQSVTVNEMR